ncbi:MAG: CHAT domain-containing protein [Pirellulaceae bacterium]|nr:CHAT domain-containing protein [Pirellulaceae bacterium]
MHWLFACVIVAFLSGSEASFVYGQIQPVVIRRFPLDDYYSGLSWLREGRLREAQYAFETAYRQSRQNGDAHGIDSVPILIRIGQSLYLQGDWAEGLSQIEQGLLLAKQSQGWTRYMQAHPIVMRGLGNEMRGIQWYNSQRTSEQGAFPDSWPVAIGYGTLLVETAPGEASLAVEVIRLDAIEVYLAQAVGLRLRYQLLGAMAPELQTSRDILNAYPNLRADFPEVLQRCHNICRGLALVATGDLKSAKQLFQSNLELQGGWDHPLTGVALLALADLAIFEDDRTTAIRMLSESTLVFARLGQHDWLSEAVERFGAVAAVRRQLGSLNMLTEMATWLRTRSYLSHTATLVSAAGLAAELDTPIVADSFATQALRKTAEMVGPIPFFQAAARFAIARNLIKQRKIELGRTALDGLVNLVQGVDIPGPLSRPLFQLQWLERLIATGQISPSVAVTQYDRLLDAPSKSSWLYEPMESLSATTADLSGPGQRWLAMIASQGKPAATIDAFERLKNIQCRYFFPIAGRELDIRRLFHSERLQHREEIALQIASVRKQFPAIDQAANLIHRQIEAARNIKSIDSKVWTVEEKATWSQLVQHCDQQEQRILDASTARVEIPITFPPSTSVEKAKLQLGQDGTNQNRGILGFFVSSNAVYGYLITANHLELWNVERIAIAYDKHRQVLDAVGVGQSSGKILAAIQKPAWQLPAKELQSLLIPAEPLKKLSEVDNLIIIPHNWLWYIPFELLPSSMGNSTQPWIAQHSISYSPTLGIALQNLVKSEPALRTLGVSRSGFFVPEKEFDSAMTKDILASIDPSQHIEVTAKVHESRWSRLQFDRVWVASNTTLEYGTPFSIMAYDAGGSTSLRQWLQLPMTAPAQLVLIGNEIPAMSQKEGDGTELFRLACSLAAMGNRSALVNRWSVRGESSKLLLEDYLRHSNEFPAAQAWRRSVLALWETPLQYTAEPILGTAKKEHFQDKFSGEAPIFWASTIPLGNTQP